jgi:hypothetical protein
MNRSRISWNHISLIHRNVFYSLLPMKAVLLFLLIPLLLVVAGCTSDQMGASDNPHPRRTFNAETGNYEGPTPMPPPGRQ